MVFFFIEKHTTTTKTKGDLLNHLYRRHNCLIAIWILSQFLCLSLCQVVYLGACRHSFIIVVVILILSSSLIQSLDITPSHDNTKPKIHYYERLKIISWTWLLSRYNTLAIIVDNRATTYAKI